MPQVTTAWKRLSRQTSGTIRVIVVVVTLLFVITVLAMPSPSMTVSLIVTGAFSMTCSERLASLRSRQEVHKSSARRSCADGCQKRYGYTKNQVSSQHVQG